MYHYTGYRGRGGQHNWRGSNAKQGANERFATHKRKAEGRGASAVQWPKFNYEADPPWRGEADDAATVCGGDATIVSVDPGREHFAYAVMKAEDGECQLLESKVKRISNGNLLVNLRKLVEGLHDRYGFQCMVVERQVLGTQNETMELALRHWSVGKWEVVLVCSMTVRKWFDFPPECLVKGSCATRKSKKYVVQLGRKLYPGLADHEEKSDDRFDALFLGRYYVEKFILKIKKKPMAKPKAIQDGPSMENSTTQTGTRKRRKVYREETKASSSSSDGDSSDSSSSDEEYVNGGSVDDAIVIDD